MSDERLLTVKQVAEQFGVRRETVLRWIKDGRLCATMPGGTKVGYRIPVSAVDTLMRGAGSGRGTPAAEGEGG
jgi:excisionase family DNA binding protein